MLWSYVRHLAFILIMTNLRLFLSIFFDEIFSHNCKKNKNPKKSQCCGQNLKPLLLLQELFVNVSV